jgi:hypothetical protein
MPIITLAQICDAIEDTLDAATTLKRSQSYDELTDGVQDTPLLQVYPESGFQSAGSSTDRYTFGGGGDPVRQTECVIHADYYARQRAHIGEDMKALVDGIDAMQNIFEAQDRKPYFGLAGIEAFAWRWDRVQFEYSGVLYMAARFVLTVRVF